MVSYLTSFERFLRRSKKILVNLLQFLEQIISKSSAKVIQKLRFFHILQSLSEVVFITD